MNRKEKFTIIIPTRERADVLKYTLANVVLQEYEYFNILVADNASTDNTCDVVAGFAKMHSNIKYIRTDARVSMSHNWEFALNHVEDGWVTFLGDDDALLAGALNYVNEIIIKSEVAAVASTTCGFLWSNLSKGQQGRLTMVLNDGFQVVQSDKALQHVIDGDARYSSLPMLYRGFVNTALIRRAKTTTDCFFRSMIPDVYSAIAIALLTDNFALCLRPLFVDGWSIHSGGAAVFSPPKVGGEYNPAKIFFMENNIPFHSDLPLLEDGTVVLSMQAIVYECFLQAMPFHQHKNVRTSHLRQLTLILRDASPNSNRKIENWAKTFADLHCLDLSFALGQAKNLRSRISMLFRRIKGYWFYTRYMIALSEESSIPLRTVFDAALVAATLLKVRPGWSFRTLYIVRLAKRRFL